MKDNEAKTPAEEDSPERHTQHTPSGGPSCAAVTRPKRLSGRFRSVGSGGGRLVRTQGGGRRSGEAGEDAGRRKAQVLK